jgi:hypothetical protein
LYNEGINKLRLTAKNSDGCSHTISAGNIYVNNININVDERKYSVLATQDGEYPDIGSNQEFALVYPTLITDEVEFINIKSNEQEVSYSIYNAQGHVIAEGTDSYSFQIQLPYMPKGMYIIELNGKYIKLIRL